MSIETGEMDFFRLSSDQKRHLAYFSLSFSTLLLLALTEFRSTVFSERYMPHAFCYLQKPSLIWTNVVADSIIGISYTAISISLLYLVIRGRKDIPFQWMFLAFGIFIVACGGTHFVETLTIWIPIYVFAAALKLFTAIASISTAIALPFVIPRILETIRAARTSEQRRLELESALVQLNDAQSALRESHKRLETQIAARTVELTDANAALRQQLDERKKLQASLSTLAAIVENSEDAIIGKDLNGRITAWNRGAEKLYGYNAEQAIGQPVTIITPQDRRGEVEEIVSIIQSGRTVENYETQRITRDGTVLDVSVTASAVYDSEGHLCGVSAIARDITPAKRAEEALRQSEAHYRLLFEKNPMPMWIFDQQTLRFQAVNEAAVRHYGYARDEFLRLTLGDIRPPEEVPRFLQLMSHPLRGLQQPDLWRHRKKDGSIIDVEVTACNL